MNSDDNYSIIDGKKYKKCKKGQIRNPITNRCIKIKIINDDNYSIINGKKYIKCKEGQIRNPITNRCIKIKSQEDKIESKQNTLILSNKSSKINKIKNIFHPFINRVSANIEDRLHYYFLVKKQLNLKKYNNRACIKVYKIIDNKPIYRIGNNIIIKKRLGSNSKNGIVFLTTFRDKNKRIFKYTCKITLLTKNSSKDKLIQLVLSKALSRCPHFPIVYGFLKCNRLTDTKDSFIKSNSNSNKISQNLKYYPKIIQKNSKKDFLISFNELADGDLKMFILDSNIKPTEVFNTLVQIYISLIFYYKETGLIHLDSHWGNFLYHKIKSGGYFHYRFFDNDYYLENIGYLWIIWDFELSNTIESTLITNYKNNYYFSDFIRIIRAFISKYNYIIKGWNKNTAIIKNSTIIDVINNIYYNVLMPIENNLKKEYQLNDLIILIKNLINAFVKNNLLFTKLPLNAKIINKIPYEFNGTFQKFSEVLKKIQQ